MVETRAKNQNKSTRNINLTKKRRDTQKKAKDKTDGNGDRSRPNNVSDVDGMQDSRDEVTSSKTNLGGEAESTNVDVAETTITYNNDDADGNGDRSTSNNVSGVDGMQDSGD